VSIDKVIIFIGPLYMIAQYFFLNWQMNSQTMIYDSVPDSVRSKMINPAESLKTQMIWSIIQIIFYLIATYMTQLDVCRLLIEMFLAQKQDQQLRDYFKNLKEGVLIFKD
jgi:hypothetical protein